MTTTTKALFPPLEGMRAAFFIAAALLSSPAWTQVPNAGDALRETQPPPRALPQLESDIVIPQPAMPPMPKRTSPGASVTLNSIRFSGNTVFNDEALRAVVSDAIGKTVTIVELDELVARITAKYRAAGYPVAQAFLPRQDLTAGALEVTVLEGRVGKVKTETAPETRLSDEAVQRYLQVVPVGEPLEARDLERAMLLLSDLPGVETQASLEQGEQPGTVDVIAEVKPTRNWDLTTTLDNYGSKSLGEYRLGLIGRLNSPFRFGDNLDVRTSYAFDGDLAYGRIGYEAPIGYSGLRAGIGYSHMMYEVGDEFDALDPKGEADVLDLSLNYPLVRSRHHNVILNMTFEHKKLRDETDASEDARKTANVLTGGVNFEANDNFLGGGFNGGNLRLSWGHLELEDDASQAADSGPGGLDTEGSYLRLGYQLSRLNTVYGRTSLYLALSGQFTNKNLDSVEQISLGGPYAVRAYPASSGNVDEGHVLNIEYRYAIRDDFSAFVFYDSGWGHIDHDPATDTANSVRLRGYGLGAYWSAPWQMYLQATVGWADSDDTRTDGPSRRPRIFLQVSKAF